MAHSNNVSRVYISWSKESLAMQQRKIYITQLDHKRLTDLLFSASTQRHKNPDKEYLKALDQELQRAQVVAPKDIPGDVITMNSQVLLIDLTSNEEITLSLVYPADADISQNKISVLAPVGTAMVGYRVGDTIEWPVPAGLRRLKVKQVLFQPEAAGRFDL